MALRGCWLKSTDPVFLVHQLPLRQNTTARIPPTASTNSGTLDAICSAILEQKLAGLTLGERSGMGNTCTVLNDTGVTAISRERVFALIVLDELERNGRHEIQAPVITGYGGFTWQSFLPGLDRVVQTFGLKTHRYGGHYTLSLKNSVGLVAKRVPVLNYNFMNKLHCSRYQRRMITKNNNFYLTDLIVIDAADGFSSGGGTMENLSNQG